MAKEVKKFKANYNGCPIKPGETMVPFPCTDLDVECCVNKECIKTLRQGGRPFRVIYRAVPDEWAKVAASALNLVQNEELGHYNTRNGISMDELRDNYEIETCIVESAEDTIIKAETDAETKAALADFAESLIYTNAKVGYAAVLIISKVKGKEFYRRMRLSQSNADAARHKAEAILKRYQKGFNPKEFHSYRSKWDAVYRQEALELLDKIISDLL